MSQHQYHQARIEELLDSTIDVKQFARIIGRAQSTILNIRSEIKAGRRPIDDLPPSVLSHGAIRFRVSSVEKWLEEREQKEIQKVQARLAARQPKRPRGRPRKNPVDAVGRVIA